MNKTKRQFNKTILNRTKKVKPPCSKGCYPTDFSNYKSFEKDYESSRKFNLIKDINDVEKNLILVLRKKSIPTYVLPQNDFYTFINYTWMQNTNKLKNEGYIVQLDDFRLVQNKVYYQLMDIVKEYIRNNKTKQSQQISNVYNSFLRLLDDNQLKSHLSHHINLIDSFRKNPSDVSAWTLLGILNRNETISFGLPFVFSLNPDDKESTTYRCYIYPPQLSLIDYKVYVNDGSDIKYKSNYKKQYFKYINSMFDACFGKGKHEYLAQDVFDVEYQLLDAMGCISEKNEFPLYYNKITGQKSIKKYNFDWDSLIHGVGYKTPPKFFIASSLNYLKCGTELFLKNWNSDKWRTYWIYIYLRQIIRFHKSWREISFNFIGKFVRGQEEMFPRELMPVFGLAFSFNTFLTNEYIEKYTDQRKIHFVKALAEDLKTVFTRKITRNTWLAPKTKSYALLKLKNFNLQVGSPKVLREDPLLNYNSNDCWHNMTLIVNWRADQLTKLEGKPVIDIPVIDWSDSPLKLTGTQAYVVNASYTPSKNGIYIPLGYIQKPFVDLEERGIEYNLAHIGFTLGHEMSHALDDMGSKYDYKGNMNDWWTPGDKANFNQRQNDVIKQYEFYAKRDGIDFDASLSVGEDLADISGVSICIEYLRDFQDKNDDIVPIRALSLKAFLVYFAFQMRQKISKKAIEAQLKTNPHPLDKYRTNVPLSRLKIFRDMYGVKKTDGMFWHNTDTIW